MSGESDSTYHLPEVKGSTSAKKVKKRLAWPFNIIASLHETPLDAKKRQAKGKKRKKLMLMTKELTPIKKMEKYLEERTVEEHGVTRNNNKSIVGEPQYAAEFIQRCWRGYMTRKQLWSSTGLVAQDRVQRIQKLYRGRLGRKRAQAKRVELINHAACGIQCWWKYMLHLEQRTIHRIRAAIRGIIYFQAHFRGIQGRIIYQIKLHHYHTRIATQIQARIRGWLGKRCVREMRILRRRQRMHLDRIAKIHTYISRCGRCNYLQCTESSLVDCIMARYMGLHDFEGAKILCRDGMNKFPKSCAFPFLYALILQVTCEDLEIAMLYLTRGKELAKGKEGLNDTWLGVLENKYCRFAAELWPQDASILLDLATFMQSIGETHRASMFYKRVNSKNPLLYDIPGYQNRKHMSERIILNYSRFQSIFRARPFRVLVTKMNLSSEIEVRVSVHKLNQYIEIRCEDVEKQMVFNNIYMNEDELSLLIREINRGYYVYPETEAKASGELPPAQGRARVSPGKADHQVCPVNEILTRRMTQRDTQDRRKNMSIACPDDLAIRAEGKGTLKLSKEMAARVIRTIVLLKTSSDLVSGVLVIPFIAKIRQRVAWNSNLTRAALELQRVYRGFRSRCRLRQNKAIARFKEIQTGKFLANLEKRQMHRRRRYDSACRIQARYRGNKARAYIASLHARATTIQCLMRQFLARRLVENLRQGGHGFLRVKKIYERGHVVSGKRVILHVEQCGRSFQFTGYDLADCNVYTGTLPSLKFNAVLEYHCYLEALKMVDRTILYNGLLGKVEEVVQVPVFNWEGFQKTAAPTRLRCRFEGGYKLLTTTEVVMSIRFYERRQNEGNPDKKIESYPMPIQATETQQVLSLLLKWIALAPAMNAPTAEFKSAESNLVLVILPPSQSKAPLSSIIPEKDRVQSMLKHSRPQVERSSRQAAMLTRGKKSAKPVISTKLRHDSALNRRARLTPSKMQESMKLLSRHRHFLNNLKGVSVTTPAIREACGRHQLTYVKCKCNLNDAKVATHVQSIERALASGRVEEDLSLVTIQKHKVPNRSRKMWYLPANEDYSSGVCLCKGAICSCVH